MCESCNLSKDLYNICQQNTIHLYLMGKTITPKIKSAVKPYNAELQKSQSYIVVEIIEYIPNSVVSKTIIKKSTGNVTVMSFDKGEGLSEKISPFDTFVQVIEGKADFVIDKKSHTLNTGQGIIVPAHSSSLDKPERAF